MKILHVNPYPPDHLGGSELFARNLAINLAQKENISCDILTSDIFQKKIKIETLESSVRVFYKPCYYNLWGKNPVVHILKFLWKIHKKYDIIHAHSYIFFTSHQCALLKKLSDFPFVLHIHGGVDTPHFKNMSIREKTQLMLKNYVFDGMLGRFTIKQADGIISVSQKDLEILARKFNLSDRKTLYSVPNGIDIKKYKRNPKQERKYITFIGRLSYIKGIDIFLEMSNALYERDKNLRFLIVGDGALRSLVENAKKRLPIKHLENVSYSKIQKIYNVSKVLLLSSRFEGLPTTILESLSCQTPVIASNVGGVSEVLQEGKNGYLFNIGTKERIYEKILDLLHDEEKLNLLGKNGRKLIEKDYSWRTIATEIKKIYRDILETF
ncbi:MAG: Alpha-D-kanosaminyltransferase [Promethearchaeota archaeon]|nr:MAG: Alpha-D-kanosaminyltransferase [Candidatus Lokiarchaeota archaeon]